MPVTTLYLIRHGATTANLERPYRLQGRRCDDPLSPMGIRQAELTRDALAERRINRFYCSPLRRAQQTAQIIAGSRAATIVPIDALIECDVGRWEGLSWETIQEQDAAAYGQFLADPSVHGYPRGENFHQVADRVAPIFEELFEECAGETILVVGHHVVNRVYLAGLLGLPASNARQVRLENCGISMVTKESGPPRIMKLNATDHLDGSQLAA
jgi:broad specificity phosphatase PhoE